VEPDDELFSILKTRFEGVSAVRVFHGTLTDFRREHPERVSRIVSSNVLEHILDDRGCLREMHDAMVPGGRLGLYLPAREELFGTLDSSVGHYRRYGRGDLVRKVAHAGFSIETCQYRNLPGVLPWFWTGRVLRRVSVGTGTVGLYDRVIWPLTEWFEDRLPMPYGLNLLLLGTRGADTAS
jgi:SAM-dependent methyltransferase